MSEFIYVLENPSMPNLLKIGRTERSVSERMSELSSHTGVPTGFVLVKEYRVPNSVEAERRIHERLADYHVADNREFFRMEAGDATDIIESMLETATLALPRDFKREDELVARAVPIVIEQGCARPRVIEEKLSISYEEALLVIRALRGRGVIGETNECKVKIDPQQRPAIPPPLPKSAVQYVTLPPRVSSYQLPPVALLNSSAAGAGKARVALRDLLESAEWMHGTAKIPLILGKEANSQPIVADLTAMPHLMIAGESGSGKSVCINSIVASLLCKFSPNELRFVMMDPKALDLQQYNALPHLVLPVANARKSLLGLRWVIDEMERRFQLFLRVGVSNISSFNARAKDERFGRERDSAIPDFLSFVVVIIENVEDLMEIALADFEAAFDRLIPNMRPTGIHLILTTQRASRSGITDNVKPEIPSRVAFRCASRVDSREILDEAGAERLANAGEMLFRRFAGAELIQGKGAFVTDEEIQRLVSFVSAQVPPSFDGAARQDGDELSDEDEELVRKCIEIMRQEGRASTSLFQRRLRLGYTRAARAVDILENRGYIAPGEGARPREILVDLDSLHGERTSEPPAIDKPRLVVTKCEHCNGKIEFDANELAGRESVLAPCPHCGVETTLSNAPKKRAGWFSFWR